MGKLFYNIICMLIALVLFTLFGKISRNGKDNSTLSKIYRIILETSWVIVTIVAVLLYWIGYGYFKQGNSSIAVKLFVSRILMTLSAGYKIYTTFENKNERN